MTLCDQFIMVTLPDHVGVPIALLIVVLVCYPSCWVSVATVGELNSCSPSPLLRLGISFPRSALLWGRGLDEFPASLG
jgi:hypothetical protein